MGFRSRKGWFKYQAMLVILYNISQSFLKFLFAIASSSVNRDGEGRRGGGGNVSISGPL